MVIATWENLDPQKSNTSNDFPLPCAPAPDYSPDVCVFLVL